MRHDTETPFKVGDRVQILTPKRRSGTVVGLFPDGAYVRPDRQEPGNALYIQWQWLDLEGAELAAQPKPDVPRGFLHRAHGRRSR